MTRKITILIFLSIFFLVWILPVSGAQSVDNTIYARLLAAHVTDSGNVDYAGFKKDEALLDQYLEILSRTMVADLSRDEQFAFYVNAYNAFTIKLILTRYPGITSIKETGGLFSTPWKKKFIRLDGKKVSLDYIEHEVLRPVFKDARVHFAVNCATKSCPPLLNQPFEPDGLDRQLERVTRDFVNGGGVRIKDGSVYLSKIFDWFKGDFNNDPLAFVTRYASGRLKEKLTALGPDISVKYQDYDWSLNE